MYISSVNVVVEDLHCSMYISSVNVVDSVALHYLHN